MSQEFQPDGESEEPFFDLEDAILDYDISLALLGHVRESEWREWLIGRVKYWEKKFSEMGIIPTSDENTIQ